jgi:DNA-binding NarL/FixJ family response regulator
MKESAAQVGVSDGEGAMGTPHNGKELSKKTKVLIVDDHMIVVEGIKKMILEQPEFEIVGTASDGLDAVRKTKALKPDIVVMDVAMPNLDGVQATQEIKKWNDRTAVVIFTMYSDPGHAVSLFRQGVSAYVLKGDPISDLLLALKAAKEGATFFSAGINEAIRMHMESLELGGGKSARAVQDRILLLSVREKEVFPLLADGKSIKEIAERLCISPKTVETHKYNIMEKLGVESIADLTKLALKKNLIEL